MAAIFHEAGPLAGTRFLSCEDAMNGPAGPVYNPFGAASGLVILACPAHLAARWSQLALPRGPGLAVLVPFSLMFLHNLFHHTFGPPALEIETFAAMMLVFAVPTMSDAPATLWRGSATVAAGVLGAGLADVLGGGSLQQVVNGAAMAVMLPLIELLMSGWRRPSGGGGGRAAAAAARYIWRKHLAMAALLFPQVAIEPALCHVVPRAVSRLYHGVVIHFLITTFFHATVTAALWRLAVARYGARARLRRRWFYDSVEVVDVPP